MRLRGSVYVCVCTCPFYGLQWPDGPFLTLMREDQLFGHDMSWTGTVDPAPSDKHSLHPPPPCFFILCELWQVSGDQKMPEATSGHIILCAHSSLNNTHLHTGTNTNASFQPTLHRGYHYWWCYYCFQPERNYPSFSWSDSILNASSMCNPVYATTIIN